MKHLLLITALTALAACGVEGEPLRPVANYGVSIGTDGVSTSTAVGVRKGPLTIGYSL